MTITEPDSTDQTPAVPSGRGRVIAYIDGFNLYFGLKEKGWNRFYWLNLQGLAESLLLSDQKLVLTKYFTTRVSGTVKDPDKPRRQNTFIEALQTLPDFEIFYGQYLELPVNCFRCGNTWQTHEEKMTDVNIATELILDAIDDRFDTALLITADSDLTRPIEKVRERFPEKRVVLAFPPARSSKRLKKAATSYLTVGRGTVAACQFPDEVVKKDGFVLHRPKEWS